MTQHNGNFFNASGNALGPGISARPPEPYPCELLGGHQYELGKRFCVNCGEEYVQAHWPDVAEQLARAMDEPPPAPLQDAVEKVLQEMGLAGEWKRVVSDTGRPGWELVVTGKRGHYSVTPDEDESWDDALRKAGLL